MLQSARIQFIRFLIRSGIIYYLGIDIIMYNKSLDFNVYKN